MDNKLATCKIITNFKNFNLLIDLFIEKIPLEIEDYEYIKIINSFITNNILTFDIIYSYSAQDTKDIFENVFKNVIEDIIHIPSKFTIELIDLQDVS